MVGGGLVQESDSGQPRSKHAIENTLGDTLGRFLVDEGHSAVRWATSAQRVLFLVVAVVAVLAACGGDVGGGDDGGDAGGREGGHGSFLFILIPARCDHSAPCARAAQGARSMADAQTLAVMRASATKSLREWSRIRPELDPMNESHINAYCLVRQTKKRVHMEQVISVIMSEKAKFSKGTKIYTKFHMITNEDALTYASVIKNKTHSEEEMRKRFDVPSELDFSTFVLVDYSVPASKLGTFTETIEFFRRTDRSMTLSCDAHYSVPCGGSASSVKTARLSPTLALQDAPSEPETKRRDETAEQAVDAGGSQCEATSAGGKPDTPSKKQRVLRELHSNSDPDGADQDTEDDKQASVLQELINRIKQAAKAGLFVSSDASRSDTVLFWSRQTVESLQTTAGGKTEFIKKNFPQFLAKVLMENPVYKHLGDFATIFQNLSVLGCPMTRLVSAVMAVANANPDEGGVFDMGKDTDLKLRLRFFDSVLYKDFQEQRIARFLTAAKAALERSNRDQLLQALESVVDSSDESVKKQVGWARTLFSTTLSERERLMFALTDEGALNFALAWPPLQGDPNWESISALVAPCDQWPSSVNAVAFISLVGDIVACKAKKLIKTQS